MFKAVKIDKMFSRSSVRNTLTALTTFRRFNMSPSLDRRSFLQETAAAAGLLSATCLAPAKDEPMRKTTHTYKTAGTCAIKADVYTATADGARPAVIWIHGGALIMGNRDGIFATFRDGLVKAGYVVV